MADNNNFIREKYKRYMGAMKYLKKFKVISVLVRLQTQILLIEPDFARQKAKYHSDR